MSNDPVSGDQVKAAVALESRLKDIEADARNLRQEYEHGLADIHEITSETRELVRIQNGSVAQLRREFDNHVAGHDRIAAARLAVQQERAAIARFVVGVYRSGALPWLIALASAGWFAKGG